MNTLRIAYPILSKLHRALRQNALNFKQSTIRFNEPPAHMVVFRIQRTHLEAWTNSLRSMCIMNITGSWKTLAWRAQRLDGEIMYIS
jgi:hypothetical protein